LQHQLHHVARWLHAQRHGELRRAQRSQRRRGRDGDNCNYSDNYGVEGPTSGTISRTSASGRSATCWPRSS
jgi:hypothetical protein